MENKKSADEIRKLRHDAAEVEKIAREELQYVSPGDVVLIVPEERQEEKH
jgi:cell division protein FtsB